MAITELYGVPKGRKQRIRIATHNGGKGSYKDAELRKKYKKLGWKNFKSIER